MSTLRTDRGGLARVTRAFCIGPVYLDINCPDFPCESGLAIEEEAIGSTYEVVPGGSAANFARFARSLGVHTIITGNVGGDAPGRILEELLDSSGVAVSLLKDPRAQTELGLNFVARSGVSVLATAGSATELLAESALDSVVSAHIADVSYVYLGGCFKLPHLLDYFRSLARHAHVTTILDHGRMPENTPAIVRTAMRSLASEVDIYLPSRQEFLALWESESLVSAAERVLRSASDRERVVIVKDGADGAHGFSTAESAAVPAFDVPVRSTVGAGDSFNAGFIAAREMSLGLTASMEFACAAGAVKVAGATAPTSNNVSRLQSRGVRRHGS